MHQARIWLEDKRQEMQILTNCWKDYLKNNNRKKKKKKTTQIALIICSIVPYFDIKKTTQLNLFLKKKTFYKKINLIPFFFLQ